MPDGVGFLSISAVGKEVTPNVPVAATQRVRNLQFAPDAEYAQLFDESLSGNVGRVTPDQGMIDVRGTFRCYDTYTLAHLLLESFFGTLASGRYNFDDALTNTMTWAIDKQVSVWELSGVFISQLVLTWGLEGAELSGNVIASRLSYNNVTYTAATISADASDNSINDSAVAFPVFAPGETIYIGGFTGDTSNNGVATVVSRTTAKIVLSDKTLVTDAAGESVTVRGSANTSAGLAAILPNIAKRCKAAPDLNVRLGVASAVLGAPEEISVQSGSLTLTRPMVETHRNGTRYILKPVANGFVDGMFESVLTRYNTNQFKLWQAANTRLGLELMFREEFGTHTQQWRLPNVNLTATPNPVEGPDMIPQSISGAVSIGQDSLGPAITISADTTDDSFNDSGSGFPLLYPGAKLFVAGFVNAGNNGVFTVVSRTAAKIIVTANLTTEAAGPSVTVVTRQPFASVIEV